MRDVSMYPGLTSIVVGNAFEPLPINKGIDHAHIIGLKARRNGVTSNI